MRLKKFKSTIIFALLLLLCFGITTLTATAKDPTLALSPVQQSVVEKAQKITVRILVNPGAGSGVVVARQGQTYTVLTCNHVLELGKAYTILTADGKAHQGYRKTIPNLKGIDLAVVEFKSPNSYQVVELKHFTHLQDITLEQPAYAAGFPNYTGESTLNSGIRAYRLTTGKVSMLLLDKTLTGGYQLGYTNDIDIGMSGGPVLDRQGQLIGINGWSKYPIQGIDVFHFTDGTVPTQELFEQMEALSWAIPISTFFSKVK